MSHKIKTILTRYFRLGCFFAFCEYAQLGEVEEPALDFDTPVDIVGQVEDGRLEFPLDHELDGLDLVRPEVTGQLLRAEGDFLGRGKGIPQRVRGRFSPSPGYIPIEILEFYPRLDGFVSLVYEHYGSAGQGQLKQ